MDDIREDTSRPVIGILTRETPATLHGIGEGREW